MHLYALPKCRRSLVIPHDQMLKNDNKTLANLNSLICQIGLLQNYVVALCISPILHAITMLFIMDPWASFYIIDFATQTLFL
jgi:hypothetical protein